MLITVYVTYDVIEPKERFMFIFFISILFNLINNELCSLGIVILIFIDFNSWKGLFLSPSSLYSVNTRI